MRFTTENVLRRVTIILLIGIAAFILMGVAANAEELDNGQANTCKNNGFAENYETGQSGEWGTITFTQDSGTLDLIVNENYEVQLCIKKGSVDPAVTGWLTEGSHSYDVSDFPDFPGDDGDGFSHYSFDYRAVDPDPNPDPDPEPPTEEPTTTTTTEPPVTTTTEPPTTTTEPPVTTTTEAPPVVTCDDSHPNWDATTGLCELPVTGMELIPWAIAGALLASLGTLAVRYSR